MKAKLIRTDLTTPNPNYSALKAERARKKGRIYNVPCELPLAKGTVIDHPDAFRLVQQGVAVPADNACRVAAGMTPEQMLAAQQAYDNLLLGIGYDVDDEDDETSEEDQDGDDGDQTSDT